MRSFWMVVTRTLWNIFELTYESAFTYFLSFCLFLRRDLVLIVLPIEFDVLFLLQGCHVALIFSLYHTYARRSHLASEATFFVPENTNIHIFDSSNGLFRRCISRWS